MADVANEKCVANLCEEEVVFHFSRVARRQIVTRAPYCAVHGENFLKELIAEQVVGDGLPESGENGVAFDIELLVHDCRREYPGQLFLRECGGERYLDITVGYFEFCALWWKLEQGEFRRPTTHRATCSLITALGGHLACVQIDKYYREEDLEEDLFEAKLHIQQRDDVVIVDVRPSDAIVLAVLSNLPIFVSNDVLDDFEDGH